MVALAQCRIQFVPEPNRPFELSVVCSLKLGCPIASRFHAYYPWKAGAFSTDPVLIVRAVKLILAMQVLHLTDRIRSEAPALAES